MKHVSQIVIAVWAISVGISGAWAQERVSVLYLKITQERAATLSNLDPVPDDLGQRGAELAVLDNNTTGQFMGYAFDPDLRVFDAADLAAAQNSLAVHSAQFVILDMSADQVVQVVDAAARADRLYFNVAAQDDRLRGQDCRAQLLHTRPSYGMRADAFMQFFVQKRWRKVALISGERPDDIAFAAALRAAAQKYGIAIRSDVTWHFDADMRRAASAEVPLFTQELRDHDLLLVADEANDFARYLAYNTWEPRPIAGADGLQATAWSRVVEQWGAAQLQSRFAELAGRPMQAQDYAAWAALRSIDEAFVRTQLGDFDAVRSYMIGDSFALAGFKGRPLSYRSWNGQLRQPIALVTHTAVVAMAPLEGFLHARNELDALGQDHEQSACRAFGG